MKAVLKTISLLVVFLPVLACMQSNGPTTGEISAHIRSILELPTFEHIYRDVVFLDRERSFLIFKTMDAKVLFAIDVRVQAGIDLREGLSVEQPLGGRLKVTLPPAKILLADADEQSIHQYFLKEIGGAISMLDYYDEISAKKAYLIEDAVDRGILERADENARSLVESFLSGIRNEPVTVVTAGVQPR